MGKIFQVRYTVGDKTVAHEHYTDRGAKADAKALSKVIGNAMIGEIDIEDNGTQHLMKVWEFAGGESGKAITKDGAPPSPVEIIKTADETKLPEGAVEKKPKAPKKTDEEKIAEKKAEYEAGLAAIAAGTFKLPVRGRKPATGEPRAKKAKTGADKVEAMVEALGCTEDTAKILAEIGVTKVSRRTKVAVIVIENNGPILASQVAEKINQNLPEGEEKIEIKEVMACVHHVKYLFTREEQPWQIIVRDLENGDKRLNFVSVKVEYNLDEGQAGQSVA
jgi:DNA-nicking Smr family endonuclease